MNKITLLDLLKILYKDEILKIYMARPHKSDMTLIMVLF